MHVSPPWRAAILQGKRFAYAVFSLPSIAPRLGWRWGGQELDPSAGKVGP